MAALGRVPCLQPAERGPGQEGPFSPPAPLPVSGLEFPSPGHHPPLPPGRSREPVLHTFTALWSRKVTAL